MKPAHHRGTYHRKSRALVTAAYANPATRCRRCGKTLAEHPPTKAGNPPRWSAGHLVDGQVDGPLAPEVLSCNSSAGARARTMKQRSQPARPTELTWILGS